MWKGYVVDMSEFRVHLSDRNFTYVKDLCITGNEKRDVTATNYLNQDIIYVYETLESYVYFWW